ncbi:MAG: hypothetical protein JOZ18_19880, partial [Chloroflexi bacterium]|nr:hypothetical protein [Chloroflexota bacterium]
FLVPYLKEQAQKTSHTDALTTFATADTGPLPLIQTVRRRRTFQMNQFAILGMAAAFLMVLMMGGLTTLLLMANNSISIPNGVTSVSVNKAAQVALENYTTTTPYSHVASAVADHGAIYYTAHGDGSQGWMLEQFDSQTKTSTPLLSTESATPLIVLGASKNWVIWLELDATKPASKHIMGPTAEISRTWSLHALSLGTDQGMPVTVQKGTFDQSTAPGWVHTPVQGVWLTEKTLLVAALDAKGDSHLWSYTLDAAKISSPVQLATASGGHIITSPTSTSYDASIYWSEEWVTADNVAHSNIWTQQTTVVPPSRAGKWVPRTVTNKYEYRSDGMSFHPQVVNDMLFFLSTNPNATDATQATPGASATTQPSATSAATGVPAIPTTARIDPTVYPQQPDGAIRGTLLAFSSDGIQSIPMNTDGQVTVPQGGSGFLLWQDSNNAFEMYDAVAKSPVQVGTVPKNATFLAVNGDTVVWTVNTTNTTNNTDSTNSPPTVTFSMFTWPTKVQTGQ